MTVIGFDGEDHGPWLPLHLRDRDKAVLDEFETHERKRGASHDRLGCVKCRTLAWLDDPVRVRT